MAAESSTFNKAILQHCTYLALIDDIKTNSDFPSDINYCHRCKQPEIPTYLHQQDVCLTPHFTECIMLRDTHLKRLPKDIRLFAPAALKAKVIPLLAALLSLAVLGFYLATSGLWANRLFASTSTPPFIATASVIATTPSPSLMGLSVGGDFTPVSSGLPSTPPTPTATKTAERNPSATGSPTPTQILSQFCSVYDINYYSMVYLANGRTQLVFDTQIDLSPYLMRDANGNLTPQLDLPGLIIWFNQSKLTDFNTFLRSPNFPNLLYIELIGKENDRVSLEIIDGNVYRCSREIYLLAGSALITPSKPIGNTSTWVSPTVFHSPTVTETPTPTYTATPTPTSTATSTGTPEPR